MPRDHSSQITGESERGWLKALTDIRPHRIHCTEVAHCLVACELGKYLVE